jgi:integrase
MPKKLWSKSIGERGNKARLYEPRENAPLMISVYRNGKEERVSLGHKDKQQAIKDAHALLAGLADRARALERERLTLGLLRELYVASPVHREKKARTQKDDERRLERVVRFFGPRTEADALTQSDVLRFNRARSAGSGDIEGAKPGRRVRARTVEADLVALQTMLNWATRERAPNGKRLLFENPLFGIRLPREKNPVRPVLTHERYTALLKVAGDVHPLLATALIIAEGTGRRISAIRLLRWSDVEMSQPAIRWRAENDKRGYEQVVVCSADVADALRRARAITGNSEWVLPAPKNAERACDRHLLDSWLRRAYERAELTPEPGGLWHPIRRKWATERKPFPVKDVAAAGGWRDVQTLLRSYQQADEETIKHVVLNPRRVVSEGTNSQQKLTTNAA